MTFDSFCLLQAHRLRLELRVRYHGYLRRQIAHDAAVERRRQFEVIRGMVTPGRREEIDEWRMQW